MSQKLREKYTRVISRQKFNHFNQIRSFLFENGQFSRKRSKFNNFDEIRLFSIKNYSILWGQVPLFLSINKAIFDQKFYFRTQFIFWNFWHLPTKDDFRSKITFFGGQLAIFWLSIMRPKIYSEKANSERS